MAGKKINTAAAERERALLEDYKKLQSDIEVERNLNHMLRSALHSGQTERRDQLAAAALTGMLMHGVHHHESQVCRQAYKWADQMVEASGVVVNNTPVNNTPVVVPQVQG